LDLLDILQAPMEVPSGQALLISPNHIHATTCTGNLLYLNWIYHLIVTAQSACRQWQ
jgi:hypothetical protein